MRRPAFTALGIALLLVPLATLGAEPPSLAQEVDPKVVAQLVADGTLKFDRTRRITIWLDGQQHYSIDPAIAVGESHAYSTAADFGTLAAAGTASHALPPGAPGAPGPPPRPPGPIDRGGPRPPLPIPPRPSNRRPTPQPPPKTKAQLAQEGAIVGRLESGGISQSNWKLAKGYYTIVLTSLRGNPVATLVDSKGQYVVTFDNLFFLDSAGPAAPQTEGSAKPESETAPESRPTISARGVLGSGVEAGCRIVTTGAKVIYSFVTSKIDTPFEDGTRVCIVGLTTQGYCMQGTQLALTSIRSFK